MYADAQLSNIFRVPDQTQSMSMLNMVQSVTHYEMCAVMMELQQSIGTVNYLRVCADGDELHSNYRVWLQDR